MKTKLFTLFCLGLAISPIAFSAEENDDELGWSDKGSTEYSCTSKTLGSMKLSFREETKYHGCNKSPSESVTSAEAAIFLSPKEKVLFGYGASQISTNGLYQSEDSRDQVIEKMKDGLTAGGDKSCRIAILPAGKAVAGKRDADRLELTVSKIEFQQKMEIVSICKQKDGKFKIVSNLHDVSCRGESYQSTLSYHDNGCEN